jgi:pimeloyl-ACP methyl ester carboxylesterase
MTNSHSLKHQCISAIDFDIGTQKLQGLSYGNVNDPIVLCIHGWLDNAASFVPLMPYIKNRHVIAIDLAGHGLSSHKTADAHYHFIDWVYDLLKLFEHNQWGAVDLVGHSMGAMLSTAFAAAFPERVNTLTLIDAIGFITTTPEECTAQLRKGMLSRIKNEGVCRSDSVAKQPPIKSHSRQSAINARVMVSDLSIEHASILVDRGLKEVENGYMWRTDNRLRNISPYRLSPQQADNIVTSIECPIQLVYGDKGMNMAVEGMAHYSPLLPKLTCHQLTGGHHVHMEQPEKMAALINMFI